MLKFIGPLQQTIVTRSALRIECENPSRKRVNFIGRFLADNQAHAAVEYALMLAMVLGSAILIIDAVGHGSAATFAGLHGKLGANSAPSVAANEGGRSEANSAASDQSEVAHRNLWERARLVVLCGLLAAATGGMLLIYRGRKLRQSEEPEAPMANGAPAPEQLRYIAKRQQILRGLATDGRRVLHNQLLVRQIMSAPNARVMPDTPVGELCDFMRTRQIRHLLVCTELGELKGIISDRDQQAAVGKTAADIMTPRPIVVGPENMLVHAVTVMLEHRISALPVLDDGKLVGIVTMTDIAMALQCTLQLVDRMIAEIEGVVAGKSAEEMFPSELGAEGNYTDELPAADRAAPKSPASDVSATGKKSTLSAHEVPAPPSQSL